MCLLVNDAETKELKKTAGLLERYKVVIYYDLDCLRSLYRIYTWTVGEHTSDVEQLPASASNIKWLTDDSEHTSIVTKAFHVFKSFDDARQQARCINPHPNEKIVVLKVICDIKDLVASGMDDTTGKPSETYKKVTVTAESFNEAMLAK